MARTPARTLARERGGITLLEVLISCGLLTIGLSTIAALLPAAGSRLTQATTEDRAALLLSNAAAEIFSRGIAAADSFPDPASAASTLAFGKVVERLPTFGGLPAGRTASDFFAAPSAIARKRFGSWRTFVLEDVVAYQPSAYANTPSNVFSSDAAGMGPRAFRDGLCWGATLAPRTLPVAPGVKADLSIVIFKRWEAGAAGSGVEMLPFVVKRVGSCYEADANSSEGLVRACSWLLAMPSAPAAGRSPRWFRIMSVWNWTAGAEKTKRIVLRNQDDFATLTNTLSEGTTGTVFAVEGIVRVDEQVVTLD